MGHLDVVGVDKTKWTVDPFGAVMKDGYLYGRGTIDDKGMTIANLAAFIALKRSGAHLNRDVIFFSEGDEENGGETGMKFAVEKHWDKIAAGFALNEGGNVALNGGKVQYVGIAGERKSGGDRECDRDGNFGARLDAAERQSGSASRRGDSQDRRLRNSGAIQFRHTRVFRRHGAAARRRDQQMDTRAGIAGPRGACAAVGFQRESRHGTR